MANAKAKKRRLNETVILILVLACMVLVIGEIATNVSAAIDIQANQTVIKVNEENPPPVATLTHEQYEELIRPESAGMQNTP